VLALNTRQKDVERVYEGELVPKEYTDTREEREREKWEGTR
jgi:hypothetical protein